jgi:hypothetical protein
MSNALIEKIRNARKSSITVGKFNFTITRPTDLQMAYLSGKSNDEILKMFVVDWNLQEIDIVPGGSAIPVPFDSEVFLEWISDYPEAWTPIINGVMESYQRHNEARELNGKKPENG